MKNEVHRYLDLLERRHGVLNLLVEGLRDSRSAFIGLNLDAIQQHTTEQGNLCTEVRFLDQEMKDVKGKLAVEYHLDERTVGSESLAKQLDPDTARRLRLLLQGLESIQADVRRLNRVQAELLRRSRRSIHVLMNVVANCQGTYQPPSFAAGFARPLRHALGGLNRV